MRDFWDMTIEMECWIDDYGYDSNGRFIWHQWPNVPLTEAAKIFERVSK